MSLLSKARGRALPWTLPCVLDGPWGKEEWKGLSSRRRSGPGPSGQLREPGPCSLHVAIKPGNGGGGGGCGRPPDPPSPSQTPTAQISPQGSPRPLTTPCECSSGKPKFICQIRDTALTVPGFSFCLSLIASGRALLKGKWCVLTGQGPQPGARKRLPRVASPSVSLAQPPYPNGKAVSPGCVSVSAGPACHTGWRGAGPRSRKREPGRRSVLSAHDPFSKSEV